jgi:hypothetical protein
MRLKTLNCNRAVDRIYTVAFAAVIAVTVYVCGNAVLSVLPK